MNKRQKLVQQQFLNNEEAVIKKLKQTYGQSYKDITKKVADLDESIAYLQEVYDGIESDGLTGAALDYFASRGQRISPEQAEETVKSMLQSKVYQKNYQKALQKQVGDILDKMHTNEFKAVSDYLNTCYEDGFIGAMFDLQGQGIPLCFPLDQEAMVRAVQLDSKISQGLYSRLGEDVSTLKKHITSEISRGIANGMSYEKIAQQIGFKMMGTYNTPGGAYAKALRIARTEGHRIQCQGTMDACFNAKEKGADVVKQWDATLDSATRESHQKVDGEIRELDEKFSNGLMFPGDPSGGASEVVNCRCALLQKSRKGLGGSFTKMNNETGELVEIKANDYADFKKKYFDEVQKTKHIRNPSSTDKEQFERYKKVLGKNSPKTLEEFNKMKYNDPEKWDELKYQYRTINRYEVDGSISVDKIIELDNAAYYTKKKGFDYSGFSGKEKRAIANDISNCGNAATMELDGKIYFSHSKFGESGTFEHSLYKGEYPTVTLSNNSIFKVKALGDGVPRQYDTEAKFLEFVATQKKTTDKFTVTILSEKHICESCQGVVEQFKNMYPNATVNIVSGKKGYNGSPEGLHTWKRRKRVK